MPSECEGCGVYNRKKVSGGCLAAQIPRVSSTVECPCLTCLVKGICADSCEKFNDYITLVRKHISESIKKEEKQ